jgi:hypothetical protein
MGDIQLIEGAGHWIQQEQPVHLAERLLSFAKEVGGADNINGLIGQDLTSVSRALEPAYQSSPD